jgi:transposase
MVLTTKWLEDHRFFWPPVDGGVVTLSGAQYAALLSGLDWTKLEVKAVRRPTLSG